MTFFRPTATSWLLVNGQAPGDGRLRGRGPPGVANRFVPWVTQAPPAAGETVRRPPDALGPPTFRAAGARSAGRAAGRDSPDRAGPAVRFARRAAGRRSPATGPATATRRRPRRRTRRGRRSWARPTAGPAARRP